LLERIAYQEHAVEILTAFYPYLKDVPVPLDPLESGNNVKMKSFTPKKRFGSITGVRTTSTSTTTVFRDSISQLSGKFVVVG
jgi:hypothetical protein